MITKGLFVLGIVGIVLTSCVEHEVIPAPIPVVELNAHFIGNIGGSTIEFTENVMGYANNSEPALYISPQGVNSTAVYFSTMESAQTQASMSIGLGSVYWDASNGGGRPTLAEFNNFYSTPQNQLPDYSDNGINGFMARFTDGNGREWNSNELSTNPQGVEFVNVKQESGDNGDFHLFTCNFYCYVYSYDAFGELDSLSIQDAVYKGWFKR